MRSVGAKRTQMKATINQANGASLCIESIAGSEGHTIIARLIGTGVSAEITVGHEPAFEGMEKLSSFFSKASHAQSNGPAEWLSFCQDLAFTVSTEPEFNNALFLRIYMGSNSEDESDWQVNASLIVTKEQLLSFASSIP
jgi:hypothetical protein